MFSLSSTVLASEAIDFQSSPDTHHRISTILARAKKIGKKGKLQTICTDIQKVIWDEHNLICQVEIITDYPGLTVYPPQLRKNHSLLYDLRRRFGSEVDTLRALKKRKIIEGRVDLKNAKFHGLFSEVPSKIIIGGLTLFDDDFTAGEIAAGVIHEIGHIAGLFEMMAYNFRLNVLMDAAAKQFMNAQTREEKVKVVRSIEDCTGTTLDSKDALCDVVDEDTFKTVILSSTFRKGRSVYGCNPYDYEIFERIADQFAVRSGCADDLARALIKLDKVSGGTGTCSTSRYMMYEMLKLLNWMFTSYHVPPVIIFTLMTNPTLSEYPVLKDRIAAIRQECVGVAKDRTVSKEMQKRFTDSFDTIKKLEDELYKRKTIYQFIWTKILPWGRGTQSVRETLQKLESLTNNDLYVVSSKLRK